MRMWRGLIVVFVLLTGGTSAVVSDAGSPALVREGYVGTPDGQRLFYQEYGEGGRVVVAPGGMYLAGQLPRLVTGCRLVLYDQRARGRSDRVTDRTRLGVGYEVADLESIRRGLGLGRISVIGWSYLGLVAARYALEYPDQVERVVQIGPIPARRDPYWGRLVGEMARRRTPEETALLEALMVESRESEAPAALIRRYYETAHRPVFYGPVVEDAFRGDFYTLINEAPHHVWGFQIPAVLESLGNWDLREKLAGLEAPLLTIHGVHDSIPMASAREWADLVPDGRLVMIPGAGHFPWLEQPYLVADALSDFLEGKDPELTLRGDRSGPPNIDGVWQIRSIATRDGSGPVIHDPLPSLFIFSGNHYSTMWMPGTEAQRAYSDRWKPTEAEKLARYDALVSSSGTYVIRGSTLSTYPIVARVPEFVGGKLAYELHLKGEMMQLTMIDEYSFDGVQAPWASAGGGFVLTLVPVKR